MTKPVHAAFLDMIRPYLPEDTNEERFIESLRKPLKKSISVNIAKESVENFITMTKKRGWILTPHRFKEGSTDINDNVTFYIDRENLDLALGRTFLYQSGFFYIQEVSASMPALLIDSKPGDIILDVCAAPGGKTSQLANRLLSYEKNPGMVIANDISGPRVQTLAHNLNMQGIYNTALTKFNGSMFGKHLPEFFDHILVDAPCSGEGTSFKSDSALSFWRKEEVNKIAGTQFQILVSAIKATKVGGSVIYSTCTINPRENEGTLARILEFFQGSVELESIEYSNVEQGFALRTEEGFELPFDQTDKIARFWPHIQETGGFFVSKLRKIESVKKPTHGGENTQGEKNFSKKHSQQGHKLLPKNQFKLIMHQKLQQEIERYMKTHYGISIDPKRHLFIASKEKVYVTSPTFQNIQKHLHCEKVGVPVFKRDRKTGFRPMHGLGNIFGHLATKNFIEFTDEEMQTYSQQKDVTITQSMNERTNPYQIIKWNGFGMSVTKAVDGGWKNKFGK